MGSITKADLSKQTGLKLTPCTRLIDELLQMGLIKESGHAISSGGRKPVLYNIQANAYYTIGIDISRTYSKVLLMDLESNVLEEARFDIDKTTTATYVIDFLIEHIKRIQNKHKITNDEVLGIGVGSVGPLDRKKGQILNPVFMPSTGWEEVPIKEMLEDHLGMDVFIDYGVNTALLAEYQHPTFQMHRNIIYVIKGMGSRTGIIVDGHLAHGSDKLGRLGQGHMIVDIHGKKCVCGSYGCVQAYSSIPAILKEVSNRLKEGEQSVVMDHVESIEKMQYPDIVRAVQENDRLCCDVIKKAAYYTGIGLSNLTNIFHPDLIILAGPVYRELDLFYETVKETTQKRIKVIYPNHETLFSRGMLGENATAIGAGDLVIHHYLEN
jgi:predicted NBD/HSP70 family sugar kinase